MILYYIILYIILYYIILYYITLYYVILYYIISYDTLYITIHIHHSLCFFSWGWTRVNHQQDSPVRRTASSWGASEGGGSCGREGRGFDAEGSRSSLALHGFIQKCLFATEVTDVSECLPCLDTLSPVYTFIVESSQIKRLTYLSYPSYAMNPVPSIHLFMIHCRKRLEFFSDLDRQIQGWWRWEGWGRREAKRGEEGWSARRSKR